MNKIWLFLLLLTTLNATDELSIIDNNDSMLDMSEYLSQTYGFLPVPNIITEPAVGFGAGIALVYLHDKFIGKKGESGNNIPPSISGVFGGATENGTYAGGAFHVGYYLDDSLRTQSVLAYPYININFYTNRGNAIKSNLKGPIFYQSLKYRLFESNLFAGIAYSYMQLENNFLQDTPDDTIHDPKQFELTYKSAAGHLLLDYDTRDNTLSPNRGIKFGANIAFFDKRLGSDATFERDIIETLFYIPLNGKINFDQRLSYSRVVGNDIPFFYYPFIMMRGIPVAKYQAEQTALYEAQVRYSLSYRWSIVTFSGFAKAFGKDKFFPEHIYTPFTDADTIVSGGGGFRYLIAKKFGLRVGIDGAFSKDDSAIYLIFGTAWMGI